ncbi:MAG TPA: hypothetical protein VJL84_06050 [Kiloniellales bacterium]|nr:hypothetical protein [Kiloniellales bacterium]
MGQRWSRFYHRHLFYRLQRLLQAHPALYYRFHRASMVRDFSMLEVKPDSELVIEGAQRSATSHTLALFQVASELGQGRRLRIARHMHVAAQFALAARWKVPALLLLRRPSDSARSTVLFHRHLTPRQVLKTWIAIHRSAWRWRESILVIPFEQATKRPASVIAQTNARFGTAFPPWPGGVAAHARLVAMLEDANDRRDGGNPLTTYMPNDAKDALKAQVSLAGCERLIRRADRLYRLWLARAPVGG